MTNNNPTLIEAAQLFAASLPSGQHGDGQEALRFARWFGEERPTLELRPRDVEAYVETFGASAPNAVSRGDSLKSFLGFAHKQKLTPERLVSHVRVRKPTVSKAKHSSNPAPRPQEIHLTAEGKEALARELEDLTAQRPHLAAEIAAARVDKDVRENAPLEAAREASGRVEARIRELETVLRRAVVIEEQLKTGRVDVASLGSSVTIANLNSGHKQSYQLVSPQEARPTEGKLSVESPVGKAVVGRRAGDEVEVTTPGGVQRFRVESVAT